MKKLLLITVAGLFLCSGVTRGSVPENAPDYREMTRRLKQLVKTHENYATLESIGKTGEGRDIWLVRISDPGTGDPGGKSALLVCSTINADYLVGGTAIIALTERILARAVTDTAIAGMLKKHTLYLLPRLNPDGSDYLINGAVAPYSSNRVPFDDDHDGLVDEDGPEDLDNNGLITVMRVKRWDATHVATSGDKRLLREADTQNGETPVYRLYSEGIDNDGDGTINEDGPGGVCIDRNFPHAYPYYQPGAGPYMTSEPETRAIIDFLSTRKHVAAVLVYAPFDNIIQPPEPERKRQAETPANDIRRFMRARSAPAGLDPADLSVYTKISSLYKDLVYARPPAQAVPEKPAGSLTQWAYYQYGVVSLSSPFWQIPSPAEEDKGPRGKKEKNGGSEETLLRWIESAHITNGFVPWKPYTHPELGEVEIGGFNPLVTWNPPQLPDSLIDKQLGFIVRVTDLFPELVLETFSVTREADRVYRIEAVVKNRGFFPTVLAQGATAGSVTPTRATLTGTDFTLLEGQMHQFLPPLSGSGGAVKAAWLIHAGAGTKMTLTVVSEKAGTIRHPFTLSAQE
ncbi:hypothetical protein JXO52_11950 [bacterium]|nr:hypothetical protein [bacterium]